MPVLSALWDSLRESIGLLYALRSRSSGSFDTLIVQFFQGSLPRSNFRLYLLCSPRRSARLEVDITPGVVVSTANRTLRKLVPLARLALCARMVQTKNLSEKPTWAASSGAKGVEHFSDRRKEDSHLSMVRRVLLPSFTAENAENAEFVMDFSAFSAFSAHSAVKERCFLRATPNKETIHLAELYLRRRLRI